MIPVSQREEMACCSTLHRAVTVYIGIKPFHSLQHPEYIDAQNSPLQKL